MTASNGVEAVDIYTTEQDKIDAVLMDMMMPVMDGSAAIKVLMKINPDVKIIAASGISMNFNTTRFPNGSVKDFLPKPYTSADLLKALNVLFTSEKVAI